jgi:hypothetical protein
MSDRFIRVMERGRLVCRGLSHGPAYAASLTIDDTDTIKITIDWSNWLGTDTIASVTNSACGGASLSGEATTSPTHSFKLQASSSGTIEHKMTTTASGETKTLRIHVHVRGVRASDYPAG